MSLATFATGKRSFPGKGMSERDKQEYAALKADPVRYAAYLERRRLAEQRITKARPGRETKRKQQWRVANPEEAQRIRDAGHAVETAVRQHKLYKRNSCQNCGMICKVEAHHHKGYSPENWLEVQWLCPKCHRKADVLRRR